MDDDLKTNLTARETWRRALFMIIFAVIYNIAELILLVVVIFQFISALVTGRTNIRLRNFGQSLSTYVYEIWLFLTYNSEERPYPFSQWPKGPPSAAPPRRRRPARRRQEAGEKPPADETTESQT